MAKKKASKKKTSNKAGTSGSAPAPGPAPVTRDQTLAKMTELEKMMLAQQSRTSGDKRVRELAIQRYNEYADKYIFTKKDENGNPEITPEQLKNLDTDQRDSIREIAFANSYSRLITDCTDDLEQEGPYQVNGTYDPKLLAQASQLYDEDLMKEAIKDEKERREISDIFSQAANLSALERAANGDTSRLNENYKLDLTAKARYQQAYDKARADGDDERQAKLEGELAKRLTMKPNTDYVIAAAKKLVVEEEAKLGKDYREKVVKAVVRVTKGLAECGTERYEQVARDVFYETAAGRKLTQGSPLEMLK